MNASALASAALMAGPRVKAEDAGIHNAESGNPRASETKGTIEKRCTATESLALVGA
jgi:hypothetical protein